MAKAKVPESKPSCEASQVSLEILSTLRQILSLLVCLAPDHIVKKWEITNGKLPNGSRD